MSDVNDRLRLALSWWLASELARRHPGLLLIETHPGGGQYDCLSLTSRQQTIVDINRNGSIHVHPNDESIRFEELIEQPHPHHVVKLVERATGFPSQRQAPQTSSRALIWRIAAQAVACSLHTKHYIDVRSEFLDTSGTGDSSARGYLRIFPIAATRAREPRPDDLLANPLYRYWAVLRDEEPVAVLDTDGWAYVGQHVLYLPDLYDQHRRNILVTTVTLLGELIS